jgi:SHS2 domain-containing protein
VNEKPFEILDHTADIYIRVKGQSLEDLFRNAGLAIFQIASRRQFSKDPQHIQFPIIQKADNIEELFINWLNELLSLSSAKEVIFHDLKVNKLNETNLEAIAIGSNMINYKVNVEIKAATYHQLKIMQTADGWKAEVILDV